jgi:hypothetical protein
VCDDLAVFDVLTCISWSVKDGVMLMAADEARVALLHAESAAGLDGFEAQHACSSKAAWFL